MFGSNCRYFLPALLGAIAAMQVLGAPSDEATVADLVSDALARNAEVSAAKLNWEAVKERVPQARSLPDPKLRLDYFAESVETRVGPQEYRFGVSQAFPYPGTLRQAATVAEREVAMKYAIYDSVLQNVATAVQVSVFEMLYLREAVAVTHEHKAILQQTLQLANARYADDRAKLNDVLRAQSQLSQLAYDEILLRELMEVEAAKLNSLRDRPTDKSIALSAALNSSKVFSPQVEKLEQLALERRAELAIAEAAIAKAEAAIGLRRYLNRPSFSLNAMHVGTGSASMSTSDNGKDPLMIGLGVSIPLWQGKNRARVREAELMRDAALEKKRSVANGTRSTVRSAWFRLNNAFRLVTLYEDSLLPQARHAMSIADQWAEQDERKTVDVSGMLETRSTFFNFTLAHLRAVADYHQARVRLERLIGGPLPASTPIAERRTDSLSASTESVDNAAEPDLQPKPTTSAFDKPVTLAAFLDLLPDHNPAVLAARTAARATREKLGQAEQLDQILKQYNAFTKQLNLSSSSKGHKEMNGMTFPYPDGLALKGKIITYETEIAKLKEATVLRDAVFAAREAWHGLIYVHEAVAINREIEGLLQQMIRSAQSGIRTGTTSTNAVIMAQVELAKIADAIITLEEERETMKATLNALVNRVPDAPFQIAGALPVEELFDPLNDLYKTAVKNRQELRQHRLRIARMQSMVELGTRMANTDPSLGASYFENRAGLASGSEGKSSFMTDRTVDHTKAPWLGQRNAYVTETRTRTLAMKEMLRSMEDQTRLKVKTAHFSVETAKRSLLLYRESLLPQAVQALEGNSAAYRSGKVDFALFLDSERTVLRFRLEEQRALRTLRTKLALLEKISGTEVPTRPMTIDKLEDK